LISPEADSLNPQPAKNGGPRGERYVALLIVAFAMLAAFYGACTAFDWLPFNSGAWVVGEEVAIRGWPAYLIAALVHLAAAVGLWRHSHSNSNSNVARWFSVLLLALGLLPAVPGVSAAVVDLRIASIAWWGLLIVLRGAAIYLLMSTE